MAARTPTVDRLRRHTDSSPNAQQATVGRPRRHTDSRPHAQAIGSKLSSVLRETLGPLQLQLTALKQWVREEIAPLAAAAERAEERANSAHESLSTQAAQIDRMRAEMHESRQQLATMASLRQVEKGICDGLEAQSARLDELTSAALSRETQQRQDIELINDALSTLENALHERASASALETLRKNQADMNGILTHAIEGKAEVETRMSEMLEQHKISHDMALTQATGTANERIDSCNDKLSQAQTDSDQLSKRVDQAFGEIRQLQRAQDTDTAQDMQVKIAALMDKEAMRHKSQGQFEAATKEKLGELATSLQSVQTELGAGLQTVQAQTKQQSDDIEKTQLELEEIRQTQTDRLATTAHVAEEALGNTAALREDLHSCEYSIREEIVPLRVFCEHMKRAEDDAMHGSSKLADNRNEDAFVDIVTQATEAHSAAQEALNRAISVQEDLDNCEHKLREDMVRIEVSIERMEREHNRTIHELEQDNDAMNQAILSLSEQLQAFNSE